MPRPVPITLSIVAALCASLNAIQALGIRSLEVKIAKLSATHALSIGMFVPPIRGLTTQGRVVAVVDSAPKRPVLLYWMSPECSWCQKNHSSFSVLATSVSARYDVFAVSATPPVPEAGPLLERGRAPYEVVGSLPEEGIQAYRLGSTPTTVVIGTDRRVLRVWHGAYTGENQALIEEYFDVRLPTLTVR